MDTKATVHVGDYSRKGKSRGLEPVKALDHEMMPKEKLVPGGIVETETGKAFLFFTDSNKTSDFLMDGIDLWWNSRRESLGDVNRLVINMDNGPECSGRRTRFLQRMVEFADTTGLEIRLAYYPPYHSKYNYIEHYWGGLEQSWNGYLLDSMETVLKRAGNFVWKGVTGQDLDMVIDIADGDIADGVTLVVVTKVHHTRYVSGQDAKFFFPCHPTTVPVSEAVHGRILLLPHTDTPVRMPGPDFHKEWNDLPCLELGRNRQSFRNDHGTSKRKQSDFTASRLDSTFVRRLSIYDIRISKKGGFCRQAHNLIFCFF